MFDRMFTKYKLSEDDFREFMIVQRKNIPNHLCKEEKVVLAWFKDDSDSPYEFSVTTLCNNKEFGNGEYFRVTENYNALQTAINEYESI